MQPAKGVKQKIKDGKLRSGVNWHSALLQEGVKQELGLYVKYERFEVFTAVLRIFTSRWL
jgi:hypothetical protein